MNKKKFLFFLSSPYFIINIILYYINKSNVESCNNEEKIPFQPFFFINQIMFFFFFLSIYCYIINPENIWTKIFGQIFFLSTFIISSIITFKFLIPYKCSYDIISIVILQSFLFFSSIWGVIVYLIIQYIFNLFPKLIEVIHEKTKDFLLYLSIIIWGIVSIYFISIEKEINQCNYLYSKITTGFLAIIGILYSVLRLHKIKPNDIFIFVILNILSFSNIIAFNNNMNCLTPMRICSLVPISVSLLILISSFVFVILVILFETFFSLILDELMVRNEEFILERIKLHIMQFPIMQHFA